MAPNTHCSLFLIQHFVHTYTHNLKLQSVYGCSAYPTTALLLETFPLWFMELHEKFDWRAMAPDTHWSFFDTTCHACTTAHIYIAIWCVTTHDNKTHVAYDCTTHQTMALLSTMHRFIIRTKLVSYTTRCSGFPINC